MKERDVFISGKAKNDILRITHYLAENWPASVKEKFNRELNYCIRLIVINPGLFPETEVNNVYKAVLTRHNSVFYKFDHLSVKIIRVFDNRLNPKRLKALK